MFVLGVPELEAAYADRGTPIRIRLSGIIVPNVPQLTDGAEIEEVR